jgi:hypothetical protein
MKKRATNFSKDMSRKTKGIKSPYFKRGKS